MDQMADEMTLRGNVKDKGRESSAGERSAWVRGERIQSEIQTTDGRLCRTAEIKPGETGTCTDAQPGECDSSTSPIFSLKMYLRRASTAESFTADSLSSAQQDNTGVDCAGIVLSCLFCRLYEMILMLPDSCRGAADHCCPDYKQVVTTVDATPSSDDDPHIDLDFSLCGSCDDASDCLELAMEMSELCYH